MCFRATVAVSNRLQHVRHRRQPEGRSQRVSRGEFNVFVVHVFFMGLGLLGFQCHAGNKPAFAMRERPVYFAIKKLSTLNAEFFK